VSSAATLVEALEPLRSNPQRSAILLDIDGTLAPIVRHAADATVPEATRGLLIQIARRYRLVGCITGRQANAGRAMVAIGTIAYAGNHGGELLRAGATQPEIDPDFATWREPVQTFARSQIGDDLTRLRVRLEDKDAIVAFHWRGAPDEARAQEAMVAVAERAQGAGLAVHWGRKVLEIRPPIPLDKGRAVRALLRGSDVTGALYAGDDRTDIDAFNGLQALAAEGALETVLRVAVASDEAPPELTRHADVVVDGTDGVRDLLGALLA
jgi:trehalose 6-phosphate phosphatase